VVEVPAMKRRDLETRLRRLGWRLQRHGGRHDVWTNSSETRQIFVPRHREIDDRLARAILADAVGG
jgi:predicted RNA binding protein YcfA (HicA-like mRNA interferase family)